MAKDMRGWYDEQEMPQTVAEGVAELIWPALVKAYVAAHQSAFAALSENRKKKQQGFEAALQRTADNFSLFYKGASAFSDQSARTQLAQHLLKEHVRSPPEIWIHSGAWLIQVHEQIEAQLFF